MKVGDSVTLLKNVYDNAGDKFFAVGVTGKVIYPKRYPENSPPYVYVRLDSPPPEGSDWTFLPEELEVL